MENVIYLKKKPELSRTNRIVSYFFFCIYVFYPIIERFINTLPHRTTLFMLFSLITSFFIFFFNHPSNKEIKYGLLFYIVSCFWALFGNDALPAFATSAVLVIYKANYKKALKIGFWALLIGFSLIAFLSYFFGFHYSDNMFNDQTGELIRWSMGFTHPNHAGLLFIFIMMMFMIAYKQNWFTILFVFAASYIVYMGCKSRTIFIFAFLVLFLYYPFKLLIKYKGIQTIVTFAFPIFAIVSIILALYMPTGALNDLLSGRLWYMNYYIKNITPTLLGGDKYVDRMYIDNLYFQYLYRGNILKFVFQNIINIIGIHYSFNQLSKSTKTSFLFEYMCYLCIGMTINLTNIYFTPIHFMICLCLFNELTKQKEKQIARAYALSQIAIN